MSETPIMGPIDEQQICVSCGLCCDGTLFLHACLNQGERGHLPQKIEEACFSEDGKDYFRLPCNYFSEKCIIYESQRADVCSSFRCQLLKDFAEGKISMDEAREVVRGAKNMNREVISQYQRVSGNNEVIPFRKLLIVLGKMQESMSENKSPDMDFDMLMARCNIFEALLMKHLRSSSDFENLIMNSEKDHGKKGITGLEIL